MAKNEIGETKVPFELTMQALAPSFTKKLNSALDAQQGEPLVLECAVDGSPLPTIQWLKDSDEITPNPRYLVHLKAFKLNISSTNTPTLLYRVKMTTTPEGLVKLEINNCEPNDSGAYKLVISNPHGQKVALCAVAVKRKYYPILC